ncbi:PQQ-dependent sugar dehydrogenase [Sphingomonas xanthus]|uniref:PQQ-dependent sugar dehydrogenase n=1 Tax=Sphingomonas xanthus TaxID=2594473 RepID=A0A516IUI7_9SPHN|nr:PQQ-dependent sugar dehydrogenase [Sphingomonas xanthus]
MQGLLAATMLMGCQAQTSAQSGNVGEKPFTAVEIATFDSPWAMEFLPGSGVPLTNLALLSEKDGKLWLVDISDGKRLPISGVPPVKAAGQGGLGDVMPHPDFAANRRVYLTFVEPGPDGISGAALGYGTLDLADTAAPTLRDFKIIWRQQPKVSGNGHFSHRIAFGPDGLLYLSSGDRQKMEPAQDLGGNLGKILRLTDEGQPAPGNPWASRGGVAAEIWSIGHRNALGLQFAPDGRLWEHEMGPQGGDEVNLILPGKNYGWPRASNGSHYGGGEIPDHKTGDGYETPKVWWTPSISPGGLLIYSGDKFPRWKGDALVAALSGEALIRIDLDGDKAVKAEQWNMGARIRAVDQGPQGSVYLLEDGGRLLRLDPAAAR